MSATAAVVNAPKAPFSLDAVEVGRPQADEVRVEIHAAGICHTDLSARAGLFGTPVPVVLGHEGAGVVAEVGSAVTGLAPGDRVALTYDSCGGCPNCATGHPGYCAEFYPRNFLPTRLDGTTSLTRGGEAVGTHFFGQSSFATEAVVPARSVVKVDADIPFELLAPFGCGIQTGAGAVINSLAPPAGATLAVFGVGGVGMSAIMAAGVVGCARVIAVDLNAQRLELARELGATDVVDAGAEDAVEAIQRLTGAGADFTIECSGVPAALRQAVDALAPMGTCGVIGAPAFGVTAELDVNAVLSTGRRIHGIVEGDGVPRVFIPQLVDLWRRGRLPVERLVTTFDFDQINEAAAEAERGAAIKPVLRVR